MRRRRTGTSTRTYSEGLLADVEVETGGSATHRIFTYGTGPSRIDLEFFFEF